MADVASAQPQRSARSDADNLKEKGHDIGLVILQSGGPTFPYTRRRRGRGAQPKGACVAHTKARFVRMTRKKKRNVE
jgi:hypothetical protein